MVSIDDMLVFAQVVESGSFTSAAEQLGLGKARVSQIVSRLEKQLERRLLNRNTRSLSLTADGSRYLESCRAIRQIATNANSLELNAEPEGDIRISLPVGLDQFLALLAEFRTRYPKVNMIIVESNHFQQMIQTGTDLALRATANLEDSSLYAFQVGQMEDILCASKDYLSQFPAVKEPEHLLAMDWISHVSNNGNKQLLLKSKLGQITQLMIKPKVQVNTGQAVKLFLLKNAGFGTLPKALAEPELNNGRLVQLLPEHHHAFIPLYIVYQENRYKSPALQALIEFIKSRTILV